MFLSLFAAGGGTGQRALQFPWDSVSRGSSESEGQCHFIRDLYKRKTRSDNEER